jgi:hypothetical protein
LESVDEVIGQVRLERVTVNLRIEYPFDALELPIEEGTEVQIIGVRIRDAGNDYIIQQNSDDESITSVTMDRELDSRKIDDFDDGIGIQDVEASREFIEELK